jgi:hypothetical protein
MENTLLEYRLRDLKVPNRSHEVITNLYTHRKPHICETNNAPEKFLSKTLYTKLTGRIYDAER